MKAYRHVAALIAALAVIAVVIATLPATTVGRPPFSAKLSCPQGHHPKAGRSWPITITARTWSGRALSGRVRYEYLYQGQVVARRSNYRFSHGRFRDTLDWPARSVGIRLTFRAVVTTRLGKVNLDYWVAVRK
ncbi:MAG: hypothetical protein ACXVRH_00755 [Thermoleophilaceae bacterium]